MGDNNNNNNNDGVTTASPNDPKRRDDAIQALIALLQMQYPEKGFLLNPSIQFESSSSSSSSSQGASVRVVARNSIRKNENLLVVPQSAMLRSNSLDNNDELKSSTRSTSPSPSTSTSAMDFQSLRQTLSESYENCQREGSNDCLERFTLGEIWMAIRIMYVLSSMNNSNSNSNSTNNTNNNNNNNKDGHVDDAMMVLRAQAATWPSEDDLKGSYFDYWEMEDVERIWGKKSALTLYFVEQKTTMARIFDLIVYRVLVPGMSSEAVGFGKNFIDSNLPSNKKKRQMVEGALQNTFRYAMGLVFTRTHGASQHDSQFKIVPLVEMFNGDSGGIPHSTVNVDLASGKWPFLDNVGRGGVYRDDYNLPCTCVYATRDISAGEELIISYGTEMSVHDFMHKYGTVPMTLLDPTIMKCEVSLYTPPEFIPIHTKRRQCLETVGFPLDKLKNDQNCPLTTLSPEPVQQVHNQYLSSYALYTTQGREHDDIMSVRQYLILSELADDFELHRNLTTGRLRNAIYEERVMPLFCRMIDYNLKLLCSSGDITSAIDIKQQASTTSSWERAALLARVAYRETLLMWRNAFVTKGLSAFGEKDKDNHKPLFFEAIHAPLCVTIGGCEVCGRSYPCLKCSRCKAVQYCGKDHQKVHWKDHKGKCCSGNNKQIDSTQ